VTLLAPNNYFRQKIIDVFRINQLHGYVVPANEGEKKLFITFVFVENPRSCCQRGNE
jgi:hypothetical protein